MNYYNEYDAGAAAWLRELINQNLIPYGHVDTRSITEVKPDDLKGYTQCHFFAGIGGWSYALHLAGWPADKPVWTGSCPCQPFSVAGRGKGVDDERHLWPVFAKLIQACQPPTVFGEQVASKAGRDWLAGVFADLEGMGYSRAGADICAAGVGAPHIRQRLFWVANSNDKGLERRDSVREGFSERSAGTSGVDSWTGTNIQCRDGKTRRIPTEPILQRVAHGIPLAVDHMRDIVFKFEEQVNHYAKKTQTTSIEVLREVQCAFWSESIQWDARRRIGLLSPEILLAALLQLERKLGKFEHSKAQGLRQTQTGILLNLQGYASKEATSCPSQGWKYAQQFAGEFADSLHELPHENTLEAAQIIFDRTAGFPLTAKCPARTTLLRGYGNAIVPQVAAEFIAAFLECQGAQSEQTEDWV